MKTLCALPYMLIVSLVALRVEFFKARARKERYREEIVYLQSEKQQTVLSYEKNALNWDRREGLTKKLKTCPIVGQGAAAYAAERASGERALAANCRDLWGITVTQVTTSGHEVTTSPVERTRTTVAEEDVGAEEEREDEDLHFSVTADADSDAEGGESDDSDIELI